MQMNDLKMMMSMSMSLFDRVYELTDAPTAYTHSHCDVAVVDGVEVVVVVDGVFWQLMVLTVSLLMTVVVATAVAMCCCQQPHHHAVVCVRHNDVV
jgi:hypothetical protein